MELRTLNTKHLKKRNTKGLDYLRTLNPPYVLKADGLAAGKGVIISNNLLEAEESLKKLLLKSIWRS